MTATTLPYGLSARLALDLPPDVPVTRGDVPRGRPVEDVSGAVRLALSRPLGFPPLVDATVHGDRIVLALAADVPQAEAVVTATVETLIDGGAYGREITLLTAAGEAWMDELDEVQHVRHDPADRRSMAFLGKTDDEMPILLNRALVDADVVVSLGCLREEDALGYDGPAGTLCPTFSDEETQRRFRALHATEIPRQHAARARSKAAEVAWLLGAQFTVQVVPGRNDEILHVLAGEPETVAREGYPLCEAAWRFASPRLASLVIATLDGGPQQQSWDNVGRAIAAASEVTEPAGAVAICCDLETSPGVGLQHLAGAESLAAAVRAIRKTLPPDALAALQVARVLEDYNVYLLSPLPRQVVEDLGIVPVASQQELARLARGRTSCLLLCGGQHVQASLSAT